MNTTDPSMLRDVAVIRALPGLGDCLCLVPALRSIRSGAPAARVTVIGHPNGRWMTERYPELIDRWFDLPDWPSIIECGGTREETAAFLRALWAEPRIDVALQLHGSGGPINWLGVAMRARRVVVHTTGDRPGPWALTRSWPDRGHEADRLADLVAAAGFPAADRTLHFPVDDSDRCEAASALPLGCDGFVVVHPGASRPDRRWAAHGFARVAACADAWGKRVVVTAGPHERELAGVVVRGAVNAQVVSGLSIGGLAGVIERADAVVVNDTGVAHLAVATDTPTVVVGTTSDLDRWGPRDRDRHRVVQTVGDSGDVRRVTDALGGLVGSTSVVGW
jgi:ADP-heptose:LPS heptosyltransferase